MLKGRRTDETEINNGGKKDHNKTREEDYRNARILKKLDITLDMFTNVSCRAFGIPEETLLHFSCPSDSPSVCLNKINLEILNTKFYSHQLMHFSIQLCNSLLSYIKIT